MGENHSEVFGMIVKINGVPLQRQPQELKVVVRPNPKLRRLAITLWSAAACESKSN